MSKQIEDLPESMREKPYGACLGALVALVIGMGISGAIMLVLWIVGR